jgi:hypothetical protein
MTFETSKEAAAVVQAVQRALKKHGAKWAPSVWSNGGWHCDLWHESGLTLKVSYLHPTGKLSAWFMFNPGDRHGSTRHHHFTHGVWVTLKFSEDGKQLLNGGELRDTIEKLGVELKAAMEAEAREAKRVADLLGKVTKA